ncbi:hypothetical protein [Burkholderia mayonis]|uniref:Acyltransferase n=1 Tax=Burkholderia mayonis TaxID=1385591 RepID=A0A1B4G118_9BURK|nr:hypothetical protein [Burkholderia mayonis]AOJ09621.1 hypothetical protein WS71_20090 [Burkholderia mayonis]KVE52242.1 hypothetical protein WS71_09915 [Burkholderia mayonis]
MNVKFSRIPELDLLRFLAALAVVFFHYAFRGYAADDMTVMHYPSLEPIARYGYPLYLIHQNVGYMLFNLVRALANRDVMFWGVIAAAIGFSVLVHVAVEKLAARPLKRGVARGLDALQGYALALRGRARQ